MLRVAGRGREGMLAVGIGRDSVSALRGLKQCRRHSFTEGPLLHKIIGVTGCAEPECRLPACVILMGATASGGFTFMRVFSSLIPSTCFIACLLFAWTRFVRHSCSYARK